MASVEALPPIELAAQLRRAFVLIRRQVRKQGPMDLSVSQISALATVVRLGPLGVGQLAEAEVLPSPAVTRLADRLEEAGWITRRPNPADRRGVLLEATQAGKDLMSQRERAADAWLASRLATLSPEDRAAVQRAIEVLEELAGDRASPKEKATYKEVAR
jgi:DNA-binding MarR family transcriptional regulator